MTGFVVETRGLTKRYGDVVAVRGLSLQVPQGSIFGLLGPNGAGKTTIIGTLLGLIRHDAGSVRLFDAEIRDDPTGDRAIRRIGANMETPAAYPYLSGRDNLRYFQGITGNEDADEVDHLLELVGLAERGRAAFSTYSLGMKHRLGIALALLGDPEILLLDEPTNGLDPAGMAEVRQLIQQLGDGHRTIVLASHLLNEVEQVCDRVAILSRGSMIASGFVNDLIGHQDRIRVATTDNERARQILSAADWVASISTDSHALVVNAPLDRAADISAALAGAGVHVTEMRPQVSSLESFFLDITGDDEESDA